MLRIGERFKLEDFPGRDRSFRPKLEIQDDGRLPKDEKCGPIPVHQQNLRPRKPVPVNIEEMSSSGDSEAADPPCSGRCAHEDLKRWMLVWFEKMENQFDELRRIICRSLSMSEGTIRNTRKRKGSDDLYRQTSSPDRNQKNQPRKQLHPVLGRMIRQKQTSLTMLAHHHQAKITPISTKDNPMCSFCIEMYYMFSLSPMCYQQRFLLPSILREALQSHGRKKTLTVTGFYSWRCNIAHLQDAGCKCYKVKEGLRFYSWSRAEGIYHNKRGGGCGSCAAKFIEMHAAGVGEEEMHGLDYRQRCGQILRAERNGLL
ncbi:hypothetical protein Bca4012_064319 [Brassica carinata]|uniref:Uncharacterized protein n=1 Tax=Brassica carinata TaxID=52824 RepID=A0A8X7V7T2_BRACI|nr:hypothetical protein Bca52824_033903 [Brassica carinata]